MMGGAGRNLRGLVAAARDHEGRADGWGAEEAAVGCMVGAVEAGDAVGVRPSARWIRVGIAGK